MENEEYIESGLSVGTMKIANKYEIFTEEEIDFINNVIPELDERVEEINSSFENSIYYENYLTRKIRNKEKIDIFLCGDSITAGVGSGGYNTDDGALILTDTSNYSYYEANSVSNSWANLFRRFITRLNSKNTFFNGGIEGKHVKFFEKNKNAYITTNKDVIVCMLGTNDRGEYENVEEFKVG